MKTSTAVLLGLAGAATAYSPVDNVLVTAALGNSPLGNAIQARSLLKNKNNHPLGSLYALNALGTVLNPRATGPGDSYSWRDRDGEGCWSYANHLDGPARACTAPGYEDALHHCASTCGPYRSSAGARGWAPTWGGVRGPGWSSRGWNRPTWGSSWVGRGVGLPTWGGNNVGHIPPTWGGNTVGHFPPTWGGRRDDFDQALALGLILSQGSGRSSWGRDDDLDLRPLADYSSNSIQDFLESQSD